MTRKLILAFLIAFALYHPPIAAAQGSPGNPQRPNPEDALPHVTVQTRVESRRDGVHIQISIHEALPGGGRPNPDAVDANTAPGSNVSATSADREAVQPVNNGPQEHYWSDRTGLYRQTIDGHLVYLTPPPIGADSLNGWQNDLASHPNETPYLLYVDDQYSGVVWIPQSPQSSAVRLEPMPASASPRPSGDGDSTDPREVALYALGHVRLPDLRLRVNPDLGLVHLPGWFWVDGYDGRPFGVTRTVHVPPEIGDDVPVTEVPADDPRRRGTSFSVSVRLWPSRYAWDFGDGQSLVTTSLGKPHPAESDIRHTYEASSLGYPDGFPVRLAVTFDAEYRVNGGPPQALPSITQVVDYGYRVQEVQSIITGQ